MAIAVGTRPPRYQQLVAAGWRWCSARQPPHFLSAPHLCPPGGDEALCGAIVLRRIRRPVVRGVAVAGCRHCKAEAGIDAPPGGNTPRRTR